MSRANKIFSKIFEAEMPDLTNDEEAFNNALDLETDPAAFSTEPSAPGSISESARAFFTRVFTALRMARG